MSVACILQGEGGLEALGILNFSKTVRYNLN